MSNKPSSDGGLPHREPGSFLAALSATEAPFLFSILAALLAWSLVRVVDRIVESPTLEISRSVARRTVVEYRPPGSKPLVEKEAPVVVDYRFRNLSRSDVLRDLSFVVQPESSSASSILGVRLIAVAPAMASEDDEVCTRRAAYFKGQTLHPGTEVILRIVLDRPSPTVARVAHSMTAVRVRQRGIQTLLVAWEPLLLLLLSIATATLMLWYLHHVYSARSGVR